MNIADLQITIPLKITIDQLMLILELKKILIPSSIRSLIPKEILFVLEEFGLPSRLSCFEYEFIEPYLTDGYLVIGTSKLSNEHLLRVNILSGSVVHTWNFDIQQNVLLNSSLMQAIFSTFVDENIISKLIQEKHLGDYKNNSQKYAKLLSSFLIDIDPSCLSNGVWMSYLEEMETGVVLRD